MSYVCGSFRIKFVGDFRDYSDLDSFVTKQSGIQGILLGEDASDFMAFYAIEVRQPFAGTEFRIGVILDNSRGAPALCPIHDKASLAIGMNNAVTVVNLEECSIANSVELGSCFHHFLCNGKVLVGVHELGATIIKTSTLQEIKNAYCEVVADASLSDSELVLTPMDGDAARLSLE